MTEGDLPDPTLEARREGTPLEVFRAFLRLGLTSFGGPVAHLGYFREELVTRRRWVDDRDYADLVALSQFLPGPASSQVGFALGLGRAGTRGALAAWVAFTLPSAILMVAFAYGSAWLDNPVGDGILHGLKIVAVAIVAQAVWGMARTLTPDPRRASIAVGAVLVALLFAGSIGQVVAIALGAVAGALLCRTASGEVAGAVRLPVSRRAGVVALVVFGALLVGLPLAAATIGGRALEVADAFYRAGALVFGGGHVVLPLLQAEVVDSGWVSDAEFLAGYGAAQAVPGPLFTFAAIPRRARRAPGLRDSSPPRSRSSRSSSRGSCSSSACCRSGTPSAPSPSPRRRCAGANAAVVGILAAALYDPVFVTAIDGPASFALALVCFVLLVSWRTPPWVVVIVGRRRRRAAHGALIRRSPIRLIRRTPIRRSPICRSPICRDRRAEILLGVTGERSGALRTAHAPHPAVTGAGRAR